MPIISKRLVHLPHNLLFLGYSIVNSPTQCTFTIKSLNHTLSNEVRKVHVTEDYANVCM